MRLLHVLHSVTNTQLARLNLTVCRRDSVPSIERFFSYLRGSKLAPKTIIDIGVADGTEWLYEAFPQAKFHLVDPTRESMPHMQAWSQKLNAEVHNVALGAEDGVAEIAKSNNIGHASLLRLLPNIDYPMEQRYRVPVRRFDSLFPSMQGPALCKIDVEGAELSVLKGMGEQIRSLDVILVETSVTSLFQDGPELRDVIAYMAKHQFSLFDIGSLMRRPYDNTLHLIDAIFVPDNSSLRVRRWR
jgi:FkbM family methyltransferase